jgi:hypothetical protein
MYTNVNETTRRFHTGDPFGRWRTAAATVATRLEDKGIVHLWSLGPEANWASLFTIVINNLCNANHSFA